MYSARSTLIIFPQTGKLGRQKNIFFQSTITNDANKKTTLDIDIDNKNFKSSKNPVIFVKIKVFLTGGTGFVGTEILQELIKNKYHVKVLMHNKKPRIRDKLIETVSGDMADHMKGCDVIMHLAGIIREVPWKGMTYDKVHIDMTKNLIDAAKLNRIKRFVYMSANGIKTNGTRYQKTKLEAERIVKNSGLTYTIFRPSIIFGEKDNFINRLRRQMKSGFAPYIGNGNYKLQPVSVKTVAEAFVKSLGDKKLFNKTYTLCGPKIYSYRELIDVVARMNKIKIIKYPIPVFAARILATLFGWIPKFPIDNEQMTMLLEGNVCKSKDNLKKLGIKNVSLESTGK